MMTWQRIDEDTYIDDTLVTCAEYQLFIDEMYKQGKCYQPDHWASLQFPAGHAHFPVVGIRFSDATRFCQWLSQRENEKWKFRLPSLREVNLSHPIHSTLFPLGYWLVSDALQKKHEFAWVDGVPSRPRGHIYDFRQHFGINDTIDGSFPVDIDQHIASGITITSTIELARTEVQDNPGRRDRALDIARRRTRDLILAATGKNNIKRYGANVSKTNEYLLLFFDIVTIQERIAGRSPAFEGIRLVKERIR